MFLTHFGLNEQPFGVTPDPRFLYLGTQHREALASLVYATESNRGFLALIAPPGMGKTSLLFQYLEGLRGKARTAFLFQTDCDSRELLRHILSDLGLDAAGKDLPAMHEMLNRVLEDEMKCGRRFVLVVDEAQNLDAKSLESIRLLSNFETPWAKLMHIVIAGQPELAQRLAHLSVAQLRQRISLFLRLRPFSREETDAYIDHRLWVSGFSGVSLFTEPARSLIFEHSAGIPRNINNLCFGAMSLAYAADTRHVDARMVREVVSDLEVESITELKSGISVRPVSRTWHSHVKQHTRRVWRMAPAVASSLACLSLTAALASPWQPRAHRPQQAPPDALPAVSAQALAQVPSSNLIPTALARQDEVLSKRPVSAEGPPAKPAAIRTLTITVPQGATLRQLSLRYLGKFDVPTLLEICALNPEIVDPNLLNAGQRLRLPVHDNAAMPAPKEVAIKIAPPKSHEERP